MEVFIVNIESKSTRYHSGLIYEVTFMDFKGNVYNTYIDPTNRNWTNWEYIIKRSLAGHGFVLDGIRLMSKDKEKVHADSLPTIKYESPDREDMLDVINEEVMFNPRAAIFKRLFDLGDE